MLNSIVYLWEIERNHSWSASEMASVISKEVLQSYSTSYMVGFGFLLYHLLVQLSFQLRHWAVLWVDIVHTLEIDNSSDNIYHNNERCITYLIYIMYMYVVVCWVVVFHMWIIVYCWMWFIYYMYIIIFIS